MVVDDGKQICSAHAHHLSESSGPYIAIGLPEESLGSSASKLAANLTGVIVDDTHSVLGKEPVNALPGRAEVGGDDPSLCDDGKQRFQRVFRMLSFELHQGKTGPHR